MYTKLLNAIDSVREAAPPVLFEALVKIRDTADTLSVKLAGEREVEVKDPPKPTKVDETVLEDSLERYNRWAMGAIHKNLKAPPTWLAASWGPDDKYYQPIMHAMMQQEHAFACDLLQQLHRDNVPGAIIEFGVFEGDWLQVIADYCARQQIERPIYGLDSFEGLPTPNQDADLQCFYEGQFSASFEKVAKRLRCAQRKHIKLVKGWFADTLPLPELQSVEEIAFARIDCDLYAPAVECLDYLANRLSHHAILVFDDWTWNLEKGETKAFCEWISENPHLQFEFLAYNANGHLYLKRI